MVELRRRMSDRKFDHARSEAPARAGARRGSRVVSSGWSRWRSCAPSGSARRGCELRVAGGRLHRVHCRRLRARASRVVARRDAGSPRSWLAARTRSSLINPQPPCKASGRAAQAMIDVTVPRRSSRSRPGIRIHRSSCLIPLDRTSVDGIPCTSVARTLLDLAAVVASARPRASLRSGGGAAASWTCMPFASSSLGGRGTPEFGACARSSRRGHVGEGRSSYRVGGTLPTALSRRGAAAAGGERCGWLWRERRCRSTSSGVRHRVIVEVDGFATHRTRQAFQRDRRRDQLLTVRRLAGDPLHVGSGHERAHVRDRSDAQARVRRP